MNYILIFFGAIVLFALVSYLMGSSVKNDNLDLDKKSKERKERMERLRDDKEEQSAAKSSTKKPKPKKETTTKLTDDHKYWLGLIDTRVNSMPFDFIKRTYTVNSLGEDHFDEYKNNEFRVPKDKRKEVALSRLKGLSSIRDYIKSNGSKAQKFHLDSSIKGALLYASSLGINVDKYVI
jgi:hypothetical protein